jgi:hypothetical protein
MLLSRSFLLLVQPALHKNVNFIATLCLSSPRASLIGPNRLKPLGVRSGVWQNLPVHFLQCSWSTSSLRTKGWIYSIFRKLRIMSCFDTLFCQKIDVMLWDTQNMLTDHIFPCRSCSLHILSTFVWPSLIYLLQSYTWIFESASSPNYALSLIRISVDFTF